MAEPDRNAIYDLVWARPEFGGSKVSTFDLIEIRAKLDNSIISSQYDFCLDRGIKNLPVAEFSALNPLILPFIFDLDTNEVSKETARYLMGIIVGYWSLIYGLNWDYSSRSRPFIEGIWIAGFMLEFHKTEMFNEELSALDEGFGEFEKHLFPTDIGKTSNETLSLIRASFVLKADAQPRAPITKAPHNLAEQLDDLEDEFRQQHKRLELLEQNFANTTKADKIDAAQIADLRKRVLESEEHAKRFGTELEMERDILNETIARVKTEVLENIANNRTDSEKVMEGAVDNKIASSLDNVALSATSNLWDQTRKKAAFGFWISTALTVLLLIGGPLLIWRLSSDIMNFINEASVFTSETTTSQNSTLIVANQISRLIFVSAPFLAYFWLVRLVVRYMMRSMLLMDDADIRNTMLATYLHLVERDKSVISDRPLILEALFRRPTGHGADTINPPDLTDILKVKNLAGTKGSGGS